MNIKRFSILVSAALSMAVPLLRAETATVNGITWYYEVSDGKAFIESQWGAGSAVGSASTTDAITVPSSLDGYPVTGLGNYIFSNCTNLKTVTIPNSVTSIEDAAFYGCSSLKTVTIPNSVTSIGDSVFSRCSSLTTVTIPNSVTSIEDDAFYGCSSLKTVTIPNSVTSIGSYAFCDCSSLTTVTIGTGVKNIGDSAFGRCSSLTTVTIPNSVTSIGDDAFYGCSSLKTVTIPNSVTSIGSYAFCDCSSLTTVTIPNSVKSIGDSAFYGCISLKNVTIPNSVTNIGSGAFSSCYGLTSVKLGNSLASIGDSAFRTCFHLKTVQFGKGLMSIGNFAFYDCPSLESMTIPSTVTSIGGCVFSGCSGLRTLSVPKRFTGKTSHMGILSSCNIGYDTNATAAYQVVFNANGGKGTMAKQAIADGKAAKLSKNVFTRKGYVFIGWAKSKKGAVAYKNAAKVKNLTTNGGTVTLYAKWAKKSYKVAFYANGGKGKMASLTMTYGKAKKLTANKFKRTGYTFSGWATSKNGKVTYKNKKAVKNLVTNGKTVKLYAVWKKKSGAGASFGAGPFLKTSGPPHPLRTSALR